MKNRYQNRIAIDPEIMTGKPVIKGTRITVEQILRRVQQGNTVDDIIKAYPHLTKGDIRAAIEYAAELVGAETMYPLTQKTQHGKASAR